MERLLLLLGVLATCIMSFPADSNEPRVLKEKGFDLQSPMIDIDQNCKRKANWPCIETNVTLCFGVKLPYPYTSLEVSGLTADHHADRLQILGGLRKVPKCWQAIQPLVCAMFLPRCDSGFLDLPTYEMCRNALNPCRILNETLRSLLPFFDCEDRTRFPRDCTKNEVTGMRFNNSGSCVLPLIPTENAVSHYEGVENCGLQCADPMLTEDERIHIRKMVAWGATLALLCNLFTVASFVVEWRSANKYPSLIIFYINFCFMISNVGWLAQFIPGAWENVVCRKDGTLRLSEPSAGENLSCVIVFVMVYYFLMAACVWFVILTYAWHLRFKTLNKMHERFEKKAAYFHLIAWSLPLILTISTMASGQIDGNSVAGICFVGYSSLTARVLLLIFPVVIAAAVGAYFLFRVLATLISIKIGSQEIISEKASAKIRHTIFRVGIFLILCSMFVIVSMICHVYELQHEEEWKRSLRKYIVCLVNPFEASQCKMSSRPSVAMIQLHLLVLFMAGILMSFWVWTSSTRDTWKRSLKRMFNRKVQSRAIMKKHKIIAQAYSKRKELNDAGRLSISIHETHTDPAGLNFELNSVESQDFSSTWAAMIPKFVTRRGALVDAATESNSSHHHHRRRNSYDSEISYSVRRVSVESRRHSLDSQISVQYSEVTAKCATSSAPRRHTSRVRTRRHYSRDKKHHRRGSSTSQDSQMGMQILTALTMRNPSLIQNLLGGRRPGNAGLNGFPMLKAPNSEGDLSNPHLPPDEDGDETCNSEDDLCGPGEGIQCLNVRESDSDVGSISRAAITMQTESRWLDPDCGRFKNKCHSTNYRGEYKRSEIQQHKIRRLKPESSFHRRPKDSQTESKRKSWRKSQQPRKCEDWEVRRSRDSGGGTNRKRRPTESEKDKFTSRKTDDSHEEMSDWKSSDSELEPNGDRMHSIGTQMVVPRASSSRSKRSVDVATQVSLQEIATQTEPEPLAVTNTATQGTQMTPPFHIRLINKTLGGAAHAGPINYKNYSYSALSLTDQGSDAVK